MHLPKSYAPYASPKGMRHATGDGAHAFCSRLRSVRGSNPVLALLYPNKLVLSTKPNGVVFVQSAQRTAPWTAVSACPSPARFPHRRIQRTHRKKHGFCRFCKEKSAYNRKKRDFRSKKSHFIPKMAVNSCVFRKGKKFVQPAKITNPFWAQTRPSRGFRAEKQVFLSCFCVCFCFLMYKYLKTRKIPFPTNKKTTENETTFSVVGQIKVGEGPPVY